MSTSEIALDDGETPSSPTSTEQTETEKRLPNIGFRNVIPTDLPAIYDLEKSSYPADEAASRSQLQYRQHHAATFFRCAVLFDETEDDDKSTSSSHSTVATANQDSTSASSKEVIGQIKPSNTGPSNSVPVTDLQFNRHNSFNGTGKIIGFLTATRCHTFNEKSMSVHSPTGPLLAIHSVVVSEPYRKLGVGSALLQDYIQKYLPNVELNYGIEKVVLIAKAAKLSFYVKAGFRVMRPSSIVHGASEPWYDCEYDLDLKGIGEKRNRKGWLMMERKFPCWIVDSFAHLGGGFGGGVVGKTTPNSSTTSGASGVGGPKSNGDKPSTVSGAATGGKGLGVTGSGNIGRKGSGNPAAVVIVPRTSPSKLSASRQSSSSSTSSIQQPSSTVPPSSSSGSSNNNVVPSPNNASDTKVLVSDKSSNSSDGTMSNPENDTTIAWMKVVAMEFNLSETAFLWKHAKKSQDENVESVEGVTENGEVIEIDKSEHYTIRFYTRDGTEVNLCGHATLAASSVIFQQMSKIQGVKRNDMSVTFHAKNNVILKARPVLSNSTGTSSSASVVGVVNGSNTSSMRIAMDFPMKNLVPLDRGDSSYSEALALVRDSFFPDLDNSELEESYILEMGVGEDGDDFLVELTPAAFSKLPTKASDINFKSMMEWNGYARGVILCCAVDDFTRRRQEEESFSHPSAGGVTDKKEAVVVKKQSKSVVDFMSRFFGPKVGIEEDPVTGSAHCLLGPHFGKRLGKDSVIGSQRSQRGGVVECTMKSNTDLITDGATEASNIVTITGTAVTTMSGTLYI